MLLHFTFFLFLTEKINRPSDEEVTITRMLEKVLKRSDAVDKESLCILAGQRVRFPSEPVDVHILIYIYCICRCGIYD